MGEGRWPLAVILGGRFGGIALLAVGAGTIEHPDGVGFKLDNELLNRVLLPAGILMVRSYSRVVSSPCTNT